MSARIKTIRHLIEPQSVVEGAGVRLRRSIGTRTLNYLDPFLLLDHFASKNPDDYRAGFPRHPHRGIETVTYILRGAVDHKDSLGNSGTIAPGDVQWMTAGRGILHEEMPRVRPEGIAGFQLWVNLAAKDKMTAPRYQNINAEKIPEIERANGVRIRVIAGEIDGVHGPVSGIGVAPVYLDVTVPPHSSFTQPIDPAHAAFSYIFDGAIQIKSSTPVGETLIASPRLVIWDEGDAISVATSASGARFLLVSGRPLEEPIARHGPFVMNTAQEIERALEDLRRGTFVR